MKSITDPRYYDINATFAITLPRDDRRRTEDVVQWLESCLNAQPDAEVQISLATSYLSTADFLDPMILHEDHPDYAAEVRLINQVEAWLTFDRKALMSALIQQDLEIQRSARTTTAAQAD